MFGVTDNAQASDNGADGSKAVAISGDGGVTLTQPFRLGSGRYMRFWADIPAGSTLNKVSLTMVSGEKYAANLEETEVNCLADGETEWKKVLLTEYDI